MRHHSSVLRRHNAQTDGKASPDLLCGPNDGILSPAPSGSRRSAFSQISEPQPLVATDGIVVSCKAKSDNATLATAEALNARSGRSHCVCGSGPGPHRGLSCMTCSIARC